MTAVYFSIIPLRRVPPNLSVLTYSIANGSRLPIIGEIISIPFGTKTIFGLVWEKIKPDLATLPRIKTVSLPPKPDLRASKIQLKIVEWLNKETLTPLNDIAFKLAFSNIHEKPFATKTSSPPVTIITTPTYAGRISCIQQWSQKLKRSSNNTLIILPTLNDELPWKKYLTKNYIFIHSGISKIKLLKQLTHTDKNQIIIGTYSALFFPLPNIKRIIIDLADDESYLAFDQRPRVDMKRLITQYSKFSGAKLIFLCKWLSPELANISLSAQRTQIGSFPKIELINRNNEPYEYPRPSISQITLTKISSGRTLWFVRSRGEAQALRCKDCGSSVKCEKCQANLRIISHEPDVLECPVDLTKTIAPTVCSICKGFSFQYISPGVKSIATDIKKYFPQAVICVVEKNNILGDIQKANHVVSTPAIRTVDSGLFENIVILQGDSSVSRAYDYRSEEKELENLAVLRSLLKPYGKLIIQTFQPDHKFFSSAGNPDSASKEILKERQEYFYPPCGLLIRLIPRINSIKSIQPLSEQIQKEILQYGGIINTAPVYTVRMPLKYKAWALEMLKNSLKKEWEAVIDPPLLSQKL